MSGLLAQFASETDVLRARNALQGAGLHKVETYTPAATETDDAASPLPLAILVAGLLGAAATFAMQVYATVVSYPTDIGGRPDFSWPAYVPMAFEMGVLCAVGTGVIGFLVVNRLPTLYDPIDETEAIRRASRDGFLLAVRDDDAAAIGRAREVLAPLAPLHLEAFQ